MTMKVGQKLPDAMLLRIGDDGPEEVSLAAKLSGRNVVLFALPGAFTPTCSSAHMPSFVRTADAFRAKGVDEIICIAVNDPHVLKAWEQATGADEAGITVLGDGDGGFTKEVGMDFTAPIVGFHGRSKRYALYAEDGVIKVLHEETGRGTCEVSGGEAMLAAI